MNIRFDRNELSGAFGDIGTDLPLIVGLILVTGLDAANVFLMFGIMQIITGLIYGIPMPVQPLKLVAVIAISSKLSAGVVLGAGLAIGITMLFFTISGLITWINKVVPNSVIRGIQFGLGIKLILLAFMIYIPSEGLNGYLLSAVSFILIVLLIQNRKLPPALPVIVLGVLYAFIFRIEPSEIVNNFGFVLPGMTIPDFHEVLTGFVILAIPQIPLSIGNSLLATQKVSEDFFPERKLKVKKIAFIYSLMNRSPCMSRFRRSGWSPHFRRQNWGISNYVWNSFSHPRFILQRKFRTGPSNFSLINSRYDFSIRGVCAFQAYKENI